jgi:energy-coupling factor transporter ATP-binding protein EcfA2
MIGKYYIEISNRKLKYKLEIERKITLIKGNSGTGKTTLIKMIQGYIEQGNKSGIKIKNDASVPLAVFTPTTNWEHDLTELKGNIIFIDESVDYLYSRGFQTLFSDSDNYIVIISRSGNFNHLPYAINSIFELKTLSSLEGNITQMYRLYTENNLVQNAELVITEDSNSGKEMMENIYDCSVISANGNTKVCTTFTNYIESPQNINIIVDGAAFGGFIAQLMGLVKLKSNAYIVAPESFEYLLLLTVGYNKYYKNELEQTWDYCDSSVFITWERYYTKLLDDICQDKYGFSYSKHKLHNSFISESVINQVKELLGNMIVCEN